MFTSVPRAPKLAVAAIGAALVLALAARDADATGGHFGRGGVLETVYVPTSVALPTSYVATSYAPTALYVPTSYSSVLYPTVYSSTSMLAPTAFVTPTAYVAPTSYLVETSYGARLRRSAFRPTYYTTSDSYLLDATPTSYLPTAYWPTTYTLDLPTVTPTTALTYVDDCTGVVAAPVMASPAPVARPAQQSPPPGRLESTPSNGSGQGGTTPGAGEPALDPEDFPTTPRPDANDIQLPGFDEPAGGQQPAISPPADVDAERTAYRPVPTEMRPQPALSPLGALRGEVLADSAGAGQLVSGVKVVFEDAMKRYPDRSVASDLQGRFEILLPDGDWRVNIEKADGTLTPYSTITVAAGRFFSEAGRAVSSLRLHQ